MVLFVLDVCEHISDQLKCILMVMRSFAVIKLLIFITQWINDLIIDSPLLEAFEDWWYREYGDPDIPKIAYFQISRGEYINQSIQRQVKAWMAAIDYISKTAT